MPKRRQIPRLFARKPNARGIVFHDWKPEKRLRMLGWSNHALGSDPVEAARLAMELNARVADEAPPMGERGPAVPSFGQLVAAYKASPGFLGRKPNTRRGYEVWIRQLVEWAMDGQLRMDAMDRAMIRDLRDELLDYDEDGEVRGSVAKCAAMLTTLRLILNWGLENDQIATNPIAKIKWPSPKARIERITWPQAQLAAELASFSGFHYIDLAAPLAFWTLQRSGDLRTQFRRANYVEIEAVRPEDREWLAGEDGSVMGFALHGEGKTGMVQHVPLVPFLRPQVEAAFETRDLLFPQLADPAVPANPRTFSGQCNEGLTNAGHPKVHFHDLKRSGATWMADLGAHDDDILCLSGNSVEGGKKIKGVYIARTTRRACRALADTLRGMAEREKRKAA